MKNNSIKVIKILLVAVVVVIATAIFQYALLRDVQQIGLPKNFISIYFNESGKFTGVYFNLLYFSINVVLYGIMCVAVVTIWKKFKSSI